MTSHAWRPLVVLVGLVTVILIAQYLIVPKDFGFASGRYMYSWHRRGSEADWKAWPVSYRGSDTCADCHSANHDSIKLSPHKSIQCEDCHGPAKQHPDNPAKLAIDRSRNLCLRCHYSLPYPTSGRAKIKGINPEEHNPGTECASCHNPHHPNLESMR